MSWRKAFLLEARSDLGIFQRLNAPDVDYAHRLHYLQMTTEKLAKAFFHSPQDPDPPRPTHAAIVRMLQVLKGSPELRRLLGFSNAESFGTYINSLLPLAQRIQALAPAIAGFTQPNPEYPWKATAAAPVVAPCEYTFPEFDPRQPQMGKFVKLLDDLMRIVS